MENVPDDTFEIAVEFPDAPVEGIDPKKAEKRRLKALMSKEEREENRKVNRENREKKKKLKEKNKKRKRGEEVSDDSEDEEEKTEDGEKSTKTKSKKAKSEKKPDEHGIWVGNLAFSTTSEDIQKYFADCGEITRVKCPKGDTPKKFNKGFAYVFFTTPEAVAKGVEKSEAKLDGRNLLIKDAKNFERKDGTTPTAKEIKKQKNPPCPTLFLGNLSFETTAEMVKAQFEWCGDIRKVRLGQFQDTGKCKGFGYIDFMNVDYATKAIRAPDKHNVDGRKVRVEFASEDAYLRGHPWLMREKKKEASGEKPAAEGAATDGKTGKTYPPREEEEWRKRRPARGDRVDKGEKGEKSEKGEYTKEYKPRDNKDKKPLRVKSGQALSEAQRQKPTVQEFKGTKIVF